MKLILTGIIELREMPFRRVGENLIKKIAELQEVIKELATKNNQYTEDDCCYIEHRDNQIIITLIPTTDEEYPTELMEEVKKEYEYYKEHPEEYKTYDNVENLFRDLDADESE